MGLVTGTMLSHIGHHVVCVDIDDKKVEKLQKGIPTIYEPGLKQLLKENITNGRLHFTTEHEDAFSQAELIFIAVGTPEGRNGEADLRYIKEAAETIAEIVNHRTVVVIKSTVPPGTNDTVEEIIKKHTVNPHLIDVVSNPEFLREGHAIHDAFHGDRIVIGSENDEAGDIVQQAYSALDIPIIRTNRRSAEMIKYAANAFLAVKISFINEIANLCDKIGADVTAVADGMGMDKRIGREFLNAGIGYGGSCFPKDTEAIAHLSEKVLAPLSIVQTAIKVNDSQRSYFAHKILRFFEGNLNDRTIAVLGLAFKPNTDDMREAPSLTIIEKLKQAGAKIKAYDPIVKNEYSVDSIEECTTDADAIVIVTEWKQFIEADWETISKLVKEKNLFDGRNALPLEKMKNFGWNYIGMGQKG